MCGICGIVDLKFKKRIEESLIYPMTKILQHRGPDAENFYYDGSISFGFTRLGIIDLTGGIQPIFNEDRSIVMICNGEIFNYIELRKLLECKGHVFRTNTDVETLIHLYEEKGRDMFNYLNGQFSFVIFDYKTRSLLCGRDHFGIAPFFYTVVDDFFIFGSEIKSILQHPAVKREVDLIGLDQIFTFPGLIGSRTMFKNIRSLDNGHYLEIRDQNINEVEYWDLVYPETGVSEIEDKGEEYYIERLDELITNSIKLRLRADVPVGLYVSGGLDSSIVASKAQILRPQNSYKSFSIDFLDKELSESKYQRFLANKLQFDHHEIMFTMQDISQRLSKAIYYSETPLKETYNCASMALSEKVRNENIKVVLTGEGADELFAGYIGYRFDKMREMTESSFNTEEMKERMLRLELWGREDFIYERNYGAFNKVKFELYSPQINSYYSDINCMNHPLINKDRLCNRDVIHVRSYVDYKMRIVNHLVADHGDRMAYANSIEARYPFLDKELVEFVKQIPTTYLLNGFDEKYILKRMGERFLPQKITQREKFSFVAPGSCELLKRNNEYINDILSYETIKRQGYFNPDTVEMLKKKYMSEDFNLNVPFDPDLLITVLTFGVFIKEFNMPNLN
ncbi:asparagine synthetase B [Anaerocolumna cellulosilytica]|uniref:asparagine synthase (glutamine-hydrolyzing) n=1 Tax=Anaerocolumna cellulosilytica TaxID=433286 RepID=A0A6S6RBK8_9FIRM|nr:asparagine synthase (glutamine-hydrolyzing) [Anaerocolumna cellulosilytica]MBB5194992.1 asparagine synthase (glutamine-hydrolyzing) [Anaerocolumna cellulosilytica]BCJ96171.1 asparagine synthetase B [Anaerocolumna cellulosilytica]